MRRGPVERRARRLVVVGILLSLWCAALAARWAWREDSLEALWAGAGLGASVGMTAVNVRAARVARRWRA